MIQTFSSLKKQYASKEISINELRTIESSGIVSFVNDGISRSNKDCLKCIITFVAMKELIEEITAKEFPNVEILQAYIDASMPELSGGYEEGMMIFRDKEHRVEIIAMIAEDLSVSVDLEDVIAESSFQVFLRVQH
jgi:hypothetical protein